MFKHGNLVVLQNARVKVECDDQSFLDLCGGLHNTLGRNQCSAADMDPARLKREFGRDLVFRGGGVGTQKTLAVGTPEQVYREVRERIDLFNLEGGFVFNSVLNLQGNTAIENVEAMCNATQDGDNGRRTSI